MKSVYIQPQAAADAEQAATWYEDKQPGLGVEFVLEFDAAIDRAAANPTLYQVQYAGVRRVLLRRFPFTVYFILESGAVEIFAALHQHGDPATWRDRVPE